MVSARETAEAWGGQWVEEWAAQRDETWATMSVGGMGQTSVGVLGRSWAEAWEGQTAEAWAMLLESTRERERVRRLAGASERSSDAGLGRDLAELSARGLAAASEVATVLATGLMTAGAWGRSWVAG